MPVVFYRLVKKGQRQSLTSEVHVCVADVSLRLASVNSFPLAARRRVRSSL